ncbi:hypothetical protein THOM_1606 [Trachipleistophora hominis]|uniref:Uncharacterized protein n=1 Tax=Trachipleistophora hominis TaxID=72359 RepID=L7JVA0_TRAHO|nr:hypothetical protein THOM_1606 [Trachipleistophora hominis]
MKVEHKNREKLEIVKQKRYTRYEDERVKFLIKNRDLLDGYELERIDENDRDFEVGKINN